MQIKSHFHKKGFALGIGMKVRDSGTWKWPRSYFEEEGDAD